MFTSGFIIGLVGGMHCVLMCSPVVFSLYPSRKPWDQLRYQTGRVAMYVLLGSIVGLIGNGLALFGISRVLSIVMGLAMIILTVWPATRNKLYRISLTQGPVPRMRQWLGRSGMVRPWVSGMLNGLLPCGLVYVALSAALALGDAGSAATFMAGFGLGTVPWLSGAVITSGFLPDSFRRRASAAIPVLAIAVGVLFVLRGLALDIPYVSPTLQSLGLPEEMTICR